jgi:tetraacyldisaccharide 4'-kinase
LRVPVPVVCVGNLVAGGAGKTPVAITVAERLLAAGKRAHFVTRGYGGSARGPMQVKAHHTAAAVGDEALLLAAVAPTIIADDRYAGARMAVAVGANAVVFDDGFQNPTIAKDVALVVIDTGYGFGNGRTLPAGPLRETAAFGLGRASALVLLGDGDMPGAAPSVPVLRAALVPHHDAATRLRERRVIAFAGIGRPRKFFDTVRAIGCTTVAEHAFADHHPFTTAELQALHSEARAAGAILVTTRKDWVRIPPAQREGVEVIDVTATFVDLAALDAVLQPILRK